MWLQILCFAIVTWGSTNGMSVRQRVGSSFHLALNLNVPLNYAKTHQGDIMAAVGGVLQIKTESISLTRVGMHDAGIRLDFAVNGSEPLSGFEGKLRVSQSDGSLLRSLNTHGVRASSFFSHIVPDTESLVGRVGVAMTCAPQCDLDASALSEIVRTAFIRAFGVKPVLVGVTNRDPTTMVAEVEVDVRLHSLTQAVDMAVSDGTLLQELHSHPRLASVVSLVPVTPSYRPLLAPIRAAVQTSNRKYLELDSESSSQRPLRVKLEANEQVAVSSSLHRAGTDIVIGR